MWLLKLLLLLKKFPSDVQGMKKELLIHYFLGFAVKKLDIVFMPFLSTLLSCFCALVSFVWFPDAFCRILKQLNIPLVLKHDQQRVSIQQRCNTSLKTNVKQLTIEPSRNWVIEISLIKKGLKKDRGKEEVRVSELSRFDCMHTYEQGDMKWEKISHNKCIFSLGWT